MFSFDDESIHLNEYLFNKQKNPGDKFYIGTLGYLTDADRSINFLSPGRQVFSFLSFGLV